MYMEKCKEDEMNNQKQKELDEQKRLQNIEMYEKMNLGKKDIEKLERELSEKIKNQSNNATKLLAEASERLRIAIAKKDFMEIKMAQGIIEGSKGMLEEESAEKRAIDELRTKINSQKTELLKNSIFFNRHNCAEAAKAAAPEPIRNVDWMSKIRNYYKEKPNLESFKIGRREEENGLRLYEKETGREVIKLGIIVHPSCPWLACSPDGFVLDTKTVVEVKTLTNATEPFDSALSSIKYLCNTNGSFQLRKKHVYYGQIQLNMHLLCCKNADLVIHNYKFKEISIINVRYDEDFCSQLISSLQSVFFQHALTYIYEHFVTETDKKKYED
ncbi:hypothetical protein HA402_012648 [Bradysia odoriphaga]|nr:hypothetical protein HA402_012648 [Bradysia odoriphaga]